MSADDGISGFPLFKQLIYLIHKVRKTKLKLLNLAGVA